MDVIKSLEENRKFIIQIHPCISGKWYIEGWSKRIPALSPDATEEESIDYHNPFKVPEGTRIEVYNESLPNAIREFVHKINQ